MKIVKMSLVAAMVMGANAFAIDNIKVSGDAKVFYSTTDALVTNAVSGVSSDDLFDKTTSAADTALRIGVTGDLLKGVSFGATAYAISTLGLENNLVDSTWSGAHGANTTSGTAYPEVNDAAWIGELWLAGTLGKTTVKAGRMELDTPFAFSEKWSVVPNTFEGAVLLNQDIPDTTIVAAWVGKGNGTNAIHGQNESILDGAVLALDGGVVGAGGDFVTFADGGAYAAGVVNNSWKPLTVQGWYYNVSNVADAYWLQADIACSLVEGLKIGAQYANMDPKGLLVDAKDSTGYAGRIAYEGIEGLMISAAYSDVDADGTLKIANVGTENLQYAQSKLYTEAWWNYGVVGAAGSETVSLAAAYDIKDVVKLGAYYTTVNNDTVDAAGLDADYTMDEVAVTATKSFGPLDATVAYVNYDYSTMEANNIVQVYLTLNF